MRLVSEGSRVRDPRDSTFLLRNNPGQAIHTYLLLSPSSIIWYQLQLGVKVLTCGYGDVELDTGHRAARVWVCVGSYGSPGAAVTPAPFYLLLFVLTRNLPSM